MSKQSSKRGPSKGVEWEYRLARLRFYQGYFVRRSVDVWPTGNESQKIAEFDCLSLSFDPQLRRRVELMEAKTTSGGAKEIDRVLWLRGAAELAGVEDVCFAKLQIADRVRSVARPLAVELLDEATVNDAEAALGIANAGWVGMHDPDFGERVIKPAREELTGSEPLRRLGRFLFGQFWFDDPFARLKRLRTACGLLKAHGDDLSEPALQLACGEVAVLFTIAAYEVSSLQSQYSQESYAVHVSSELSSGLGDPAGLRRLLRRIDMMNRAMVDDIHDEYTKTGVARVVRAVPQLEVEILRPPEWVDGFIDLSNRLQLRPQIATNVLRNLDLRLGYRMGSKRSGAKVEKGWSAEARPVKEVSDLIEQFLATVWDAPREGLGLTPLPQAEVGTTPLPVEAAGTASPGEAMALFDQSMGYDADPDSA